MNDLMTFDNSEFGSMRVVTMDGEPWFVGRDVATVLGYSNARKALADHVDDDDKGVTKCDTLGGVQEMAVINESGLYSLILSSKLPTAKSVKRWVTSEVLPSIRKNGGYITGQNELSNEELFARAVLLAQSVLAEREQRIKQLEASNTALTEKVKELEPAKRYVDTILSSVSTMTVTQIAADYGLTANKLNKILSEAGVQRKVNRQWILYKKYIENGYTESETIQYAKKNGDIGTTVFTKWTQRGRLFINDLLKAYGILPLIDR